MLFFEARANGAEIQDMALRTLHNYPCLRVS